MLIQGVAFLEADANCSDANLQHSLCMQTVPHMVVRLQENRLLSKVEPDTKAMSSVIDTYLIVAC